MADKKRCELCGKQIKESKGETAMPYYAGKIQNDQNPMYRHDDCPK